MRRLTTIKACTALSISKRQASRPDTTLSTMWLLEPSRQLAFQFPKSQQVFAVQMVGALTACLSVHGRQAGKPAVWDVTVTCTTAPSYLDSSSHEAGAAAEMAASHKTAKYSNPAARHTFFPIAVESHGPLCEDAHGLLRDLGRRLSEFSGDVREVQFFNQRISVVVQRFKRCVACCTTVF